MSKMEKKFFEAAKNGDLQQITEMFEEGIGINYQYGAQLETPLMGAVQEGHDEVVKFLIDHGANVNATQSGRRNVLSFAVSNGHYSIAQMLIEKGANVDGLDCAGATPLFFAVGENQAECVELLIAKGAQVDLMNNACHAPLHYAGIYGREKAAQVLIENKAQINVRNDEGITPLHWACRNGHLQTCRILLWNGAKLNLNDQNGQNESHWASYNGHYSILELLIANGACLNACDQNGRTALHLAAGQGRNDAVKLLIANGVDVSIKDTSKKTFLSHAYDGNHFKILKEQLPLCERSLYADDDYSLLWHACKDGHLELVDFLLQFDIDLLTMNGPDGTSPHFMAAVKGHENIIDLLRDKFRMDITYEENTKSFEDSFMIRLTKKFPVFNEKVEECNKKQVVKVSKGNHLSLFEDFNGHILALCPLLGALSSDENIIRLRDICLSDCEEFCKWECDCMIVRDMISVMQFVERELMKRIPELGLTFILVGSIVEGTRIGAATEIDLMVQFEGRRLQAQPLLVEDDPFHLKISASDEKHPLDEWSMDGIFYFERFFAFLLHSVDEIIDKGQDQISLITENRISEFNRRDSQCSLKCPFWDENYYTHCENCIFHVTQTKCGACLVFDWEQKDIRKTVLTIDLIPVLPIKGKNTNELLKLVTKTLFDKRPPNWRKYLTKFINSDRILPESFQQQFDREGCEEKPIQVAVKLLNFGPDRNFIIRPFQQLGVTKEFGENEALKAVYCQIKCMKELLGAEKISSYFIKKVLLSKAMKEKMKGLTNDIFLALQHPDLREKFEKVIDYEKWDKDEIIIPIIKKMDCSEI